MDRFLLVEEALPKAAAVAEGVSVVRLLVVQVLVVLELVVLELVVPDVMVLEFVVRLLRTHIEHEHQQPTSGRL